MKITLTRVEKIAIVLISAMMVWIFLVSQYTRNIESALGRLGVLIIFSVLILSLIICGWAYEKETRENLNQIHKEKGIIEENTDEQLNKPFEPK